MQGALKIAIVGDYNVEFHSHSAVNSALTTIENWLGVNINFYWINSREIAEFKDRDYDNFHGFWIGPGPFASDFQIQQAMFRMIELKKNILVTDRAYFLYLSCLSDYHGFKPHGVSENLFAANTFDQLDIVAIDPSVNTLYGGRPKIEFTINEYEITSTMESALLESGWKLLAKDQKGRPIIWRQGKNAVLTSVCPQITSTRELPHPLIKTWLLSIEQMQGVKVRS